MPNVREVFPGLEKSRRVKRGLPHQLSWDKAPAIDQVIPKLAPVIVDSHMKVMDATTHTEMRRYILRNGNRFGYLCFKTSNILLDRCRSYNDFQKIFDSLEQSIRWLPTFAGLVEYVAQRSTSPSYTARIRQLHI